MKPPNNFYLYSLFFLLIGCSTSETDPFHWTRFRGYNGQGVDSKGSAPVKWDSTEYQSFDLINNATQTYHSIFKNHT